MSERWLSLAEIAAYLGVSKDSVYRWLEEREMPAHKVGRQWKFKCSEVDTWVRSGQADLRTAKAAANRPTAARAGRGQ